MLNLIKLLRYICLPITLTLLILCESLSATYKSPDGANVILWGITKVALVANSESCPRAGQCKGRPATTLTRPSGVSCKIIWSSTMCSELSRGFIARSVGHLR